MQGLIEFIFNNHFDSNLLRNIIVKEFWKSVMIWQSYGSEFRVQFSVHPVGLTARYCDREPQAIHPGFAGEKLGGGASYGPKWQTKCNHQRPGHAPAGNFRLQFEMRREAEINVEVIFT